MPLVRTQTDRRARSRSALLHSAARGPSTYRYANLVLERVITEAGHTPGARYIPSSQVGRTWRWLSQTGSMRPGKAWSGI